MNRFVCVCTALDCLQSRCCKPITACDNGRFELFYRAGWFRGRKQGQGPFWLGADSQTTQPTIVTRRGTILQTYRRYRGARAAAEAGRGTAATPATASFIMTVFQSQFLWGPSLPAAVYSATACGQQCHASTEGGHNPFAYSHRRRKLYTSNWWVLKLWYVSQYY